MAVKVDIYANFLDEGYILLPERYDPRRTQNNSGIPLLDLVDFNDSVYTPEKINIIKKRILVLDTSNSYNGFISFDKDKIYSDIASNKKKFTSGSIIISRLRPYLKQIGYVDEYISDEFIIFGSTEYFELIPKTDESISFLIPFLLSNKIQKYLQFSIEGGNHPRFRIDALKNIIVPTEVIVNRREISNQFEQSIKLLREGFNLMYEIVSTNNVA